MYNASKPTLSATVADTMSYTPGAWQNARARTRSAKAARRSAVLTTSSLASSAAQSPTTAPVSLASAVCRLRSFMTS